MGSSGAGRAFIGSFTSAGGRGITAVAVDRDTGALTVLAATDAVPDPSFLTVGPASETGVRLLYAVSETSDGAAAAWEIGDDGLRPVGPVRSVDGSSPTHLALAAGHLVTANYGSGSVTALPVRADGSSARRPPCCGTRAAGPTPAARRARTRTRCSPTPRGTGS